MKPHFKSIKEHTSEWADVLVSTDSSDRWCAVYDWLKLASGIERISVDLTTPHSYMCGGAMDYEDRQSRNQSDLVNDLIKFMTVWSSLEAFLEDGDVDRALVATTAPGKIGRTCAFLKNTFGDISPIKGLKTCVQVLGHQEWLKLLDAEKRYNNPPSFVSSVGLGLYVVYKLRNSFAHGSYAFPDGNMEPEEVEWRCKLIRLATRIVLLSEQAVFYALSQPGDLVDMWWDHDLEDSDRPVIDVVPGFHFENWKELDLSHVQ